jgi:hypothetical protein
MATAEETHDTLRRSVAALRHEAAYHALVQSLGDLYVMECDALVSANAERLPVQQGRCQALRELLGQLQGDQHG